MGYGAINASFGDPSGQTGYQHARQPSQLNSPFLYSDNQTPLLQGQEGGGLQSWEAQLPGEQAISTPSPRTSPQSSLKERGIGEFLDVYA
jgi:hypothetical protein